MLEPFTFPDGSCSFYYCEGAAEHDGPCWDYLGEHYPDSPHGDPTGCRCERCQHYHV